MPGARLRHASTMNSQRTTDSRKLAIQGFDLVHGGHNFYALLEFDVTDLRHHLRSLRADGAGGSLYSFFLKAIGKVLEAEPLFNTFIDYRKTSTFSTVDICIPIEVTIDGKVVNRQYVIQDIAKKSLREVTAEIEVAKANPEDKSGFVGSRARERVLGLLPRWLLRFAFSMVARNHRMVHKLSGSIFVTSVSPFSNVPGFVIPYAGGPKATSFAFGSITKKPIVWHNQIETREIASVTAIFNHNLVDESRSRRPHRGSFASRTRMD